LVKPLEMGYHLLGFPAVFNVHSLTISNAKTSSIVSDVYRLLLDFAALLAWRRGSSDQRIHPLHRVRVASAA